MNILNQAFEPTPHLAIFMEQGIRTRVDPWPDVVGKLLVLVKDVEQGHQVITQFEYGRRQLALVIV